MQNKRRKKYIGTSLQKKVLSLVFAASLIPTFIIAAGLYYLILDMVAWQMTIPDMVVSNLIPAMQKVNTVLMILVPLVILFLWLIALDLSNRIAGPVYRIEKELEERIAGAKKGPIVLRRRDELKSLADKINKLIS